MTLTELKYMTALVRECHFGRAAEACFVSQPTLSVAIKRLEEMLDTKLFERSKTGVSPTEVGLKVAEQAQRVLEEADRLKQIAKEGTNPLRGRIRLGAIYTIAPYLLPRLLPMAKQHLPEMPLIINENYTHELTRKLKDGELDVIIISLPYKEDGVNTLPLYDEPFSVLMPSDHPWTREGEICSDHLSEQPVMLLGEGHCFRDQILEICPECRKNHLLDNDLIKALEGSSLETIRNMVEGGLGITILPQTAVRPENTIRPLVSSDNSQNSQPYRTVALAWRSSFPRTAAVESLAALIASCELDGVILHGQETAAA